MIGEVKGSGAVCEIVNHQGHEGAPRKYLRPEAFVILRVLGGLGSCELHLETAPPRNLLMFSPVFPKCSNAQYRAQERNSDPHCFSEGG